MTVRHVYSWKSQIASKKGWLASKNLNGEFPLIVTKFATGQETILILIADGMLINLD